MACAVLFLDSRDNDLFMTPAAVLRILHVKGFFSVMTLAAKITLRDLAHVHFIRPLRHLEHGIVTAGTFESFSFHMDLMAEDHG